MVQVNFSRHMMMQSHLKIKMESHVKMKTKSQVKISFPGYNLF